MYSQSSSCVVPSGNIFDKLSEMPFWGYLAFIGVVLLISSIFGDAKYSHGSHQSYNYVRSYAPHRINRNITLPVRVPKMPKINYNISRIKVGDISASKYVHKRPELITVGSHKIDTAWISIAKSSKVYKKDLFIPGQNKPAQAPVTDGDKDIEQSQPAVDTPVDTIAA